MDSWRQQTSTSTCAVVFVIVGAGSLLSLMSRSALANGSASLSSTGSHSASPSRRAPLAAESPRSWAGESSPPRSPVRDPGMTKGGLEMETSIPGETTAPSAAASTDTVTSVHPAIHPAPEGTIRVDGPLFDRRGRERASAIDVRRVESPRERAMRLHPAGKAKIFGRSVDKRDAGGASRAEKGKRGDLESRSGQGEIDDRKDPSPATSPDTRSATGTPTTPRPRLEVADESSRDGSKSSGRVCTGNRHLVRSGDTLWSIAAEALETEDIRRIARCWPKIHRHNRNVIGANPHLIYPGQVLDLPDECDD